MKPVLWIAGVWLPLAMAGCIHRQPIVAIPEANLRSEVKLEERIHLPLTAAGREKVEAFLAAGGNTDNIDNHGKLINISDPDAPKNFQPLLNRLSEPNHLRVEDLTPRNTLNAWLHGKAIFGVADAREPAPRPQQALAICDGRYCWVFYPQGHDLTELTVAVKWVPPRQPREKN
jgi:hypothetical protein